MRNRVAFGFPMSSGSGFLYWGLKLFQDISKLSVGDSRVLLSLIVAPVARFQTRLPHHVKLKEETMLWKQFLTPVQSLNAEKARQFISERPSSDVTILDVRQPGEYESGHIPGSKLLPMGDLGNRIKELDPEKPILVY